MPCSAERKPITENISLLMRIPLGVTAYDGNECNVPYRIPKRLSRHTGFRDKVSHGLGRGPSCPPCAVSEGHHHQCFQLLINVSTWPRACSIEAEYKDRSMKPTANQCDADLNRLHEELEAVERDRVSTEEVLRDSSVDRNPAVRLLRDWRRHYRGSVLCQQ